MKLDTTKHKPLSIKDLKHKRKILKEHLESKNNHFWQWDPNDDCFHFIYKAKDSASLGTIIRLYTPSMRVQEYSALGVTTMLPNLSLQEKRNLIQKLIPLHFTPTPEDKELAFLEWWERTPFNKGILLQLTLPHDLLIYIATFIIDLEKPLF